jgi:hypothetical protein
MKAPLVYVALTVALVQTIQAAPESEQFGPEIEGFRFGVQLDTNVFGVKQGIGVTLTLTNSHDHPRFVLYTGLQKFEFKLTDANGVEIPRKSVARRLPHGIIEVRNDGPIGDKTGMKPGEVDTTSSNLRFVFDLDTPGKYKLTVARQVPTLATATNTNLPLVFTNVVSNPVEFTIRAE